MKILNIYFKNINSLEGENRINFEQPPLSDSGVFAITGPNGAGKSSILDAITLALYGETFRFHQPAEHVMTRNTSDCFSVVEFAIDNEKYQAHWQAKRANDASISSAMKLVHSNTGEELASTAQQVCNRITEITGMNFRNFTRSVLLAQGDFAAFLNALDNERMDILEKIISSDIYDDYKNDMVAKVKKEQVRLQQLHQDVNAIPLLPPEKREALSHDLIDFNDQQSELEQASQQLKQQQQALTKVTELEHRISEQKTALQALASQSESIQKKIDLLATSEDALLLKDDLAALQEQQQALHQSKTTLTTYQAELKLLQQELAALGPTTPPAIASNKSLTDQIHTIDRIRSQVALLNANKQSENDLYKSLDNQITEKQAILATTNTWLQDHTGDASLLDQLPEVAALKNLRLELTELENQQKAHSQWSKQASSSLNSNLQLHEKGNKKSGDLKQKLATAEKKLEQLAEGRTLAEIDELYQDQRERVKHHEEFSNLALINQKLSKPSSAGFFSFFKSKPEINDDVASIQQKLDHLKKDIKLEENIKLALEEAALQNSLMRKMTADRQHLTDGKPCPLCGALNHPYAITPPVSSNAERALLDQKEKMQNLAAAIAKQEQILATAQKMAEKKRITDAEIQKTQSKWLTLSNRLNTGHTDMAIGNTSLIQQLLREETQQLKNIATLATEYRNTEKSIAKLKALIDKTENQLESLQSSNQALDSDWQERNRIKTELDNAYNQCQQNEKALASQVTIQLQAIDETLPAAGKEDALIDKLNSRRQDYHSHLIRHKNLTDELIVLAAKQQHCHAEADNYDQQIQQISKQLQSEENIGLHLALIEKQRLIADIEQRISQQDGDNQVLQQTLKEKMQATTFTTQHDVNIVLQLLEQKTDIEQQKTEIDQLIAEKTLALEKNQTQLTIERASIQANTTLEELEQRLWQTAEKLQIATLETQRIESLLTDQDLLQKKYATVALQLQNQQDIVQQLSDEQAQMEAENGMVFRRRVQKQTIEKLLSQTNTMLEKISGRYYLRQTFSDQGLALEIEDTYQGNIRRLPKSLSGGESFIVSLALALGLSELANNHKAVDSLFIDEGFGNLDSETLYTVISTLENLRAHGKTVGVISHVESVQKRFKTQLQIVKKPNGMGMLKKAS